MSDIATTSLEATDQAAEAVRKPNTTRITLDDIKAQVKSTEYIVPLTQSLMTICVVVMENGYALVGKSAPADPERFDAELGKQFALEDALRQAWPLMGYMLRERLHERAQIEEGLKE